MTIIFDKNVPWPLSRHLGAHFVTTVQKEGWGGIQNGALISKIDGRFDVLLLADKNLRYQQNLSSRKIAIVEIPTNRWPLLEPLIPNILSAIEGVQSGSYRIIDSDEQA
jgi:hypothetical protein